MKKSDKEVLVHRLKWILKYIEENRVDDTKNEIEELIDEIEKFDSLIPF